MQEGIGETFQRETKYQRGRMPGGWLDWTTKPETYKRYADAPRFPLPPAETRGGAPLWEVIKKRRSLRSFQNRPLKKGDLSMLLWAAQGSTQAVRGFEFRAAPSAGALYPVETYLAIHSVEGIEPGVYHYAVADHALEQLKKGDFRLDAAHAALDQEIAYTANAVFIWTAIFERSKWKYKQRAYRYVYLDAGHIAQNVALAAVGLGLGSCQIAAIYDDEANALVGVDGIEESTVYMTVVGRGE